MQVYLFISETHSSVRALTSDQTGGNLPSDYAPWRAIKDMRLTRVESISDPVGAAIARNGFFLMSGSGRRLEPQGKIT